jgi:hypothetical protein
MPTIRRGACAVGCLTATIGSAVWLAARARKFADAEGPRCQTGVQRGLRKFKTIV